MRVSLFAEAVLKPATLPSVPVSPQLRNSGSAESLANVTGKESQRIRDMDRGLFGEKGRNTHSRENAGHLKMRKAYWGVQGSFLIGGFVRDGLEEVCEGELSPG